MTLETKQNKLKHYIIRVPKSDAAFTYFQFEANDGLCFYSTLESSLKEPFRDIDIKTHESLSEELTRLLTHLGKSINIEILLDEMIDDQ